MSKKKRLGEILVEENLITKEQLNEALKLQVGGVRRLGYILIQMGIITSPQITTVLAKQLDKEVVRVRDAFQEDSKRVLPRYLCRKYGAIPYVIRDNIMSVVMTNPLDEQAIMDIESYTGYAVEPLLGEAKNIAESITKHIPLQLKDIFNAQNFGLVGKIGAGITAICVVVLVVMLFHNARVAKYGTESVTENAVIFHNHDLILSLEEGKYAIMGRGVYANGTFSVGFKKIEDLENFIKNRSRSFSKQQIEWMNYILTEKLGAENAGV